MTKLRVQCTSRLQKRECNLVAYLPEDVWQDVLDVLDIDFVDESIERLAQGVPSHALKLGTRLVIGFTHHLWHTHTAVVCRPLPRKMYQLVACRQLMCCDCG